MNLLLITALLAGLVHCVEKEKIHMTRLDLETGRFRRSVDPNCKRTVSLLFKLRGEKVLLNLLRSDINLAEPKTSILENGTITNLPQSLNKTFCVYLDVNTNSSVLVECVNGTCKVHGTFASKNEMYRMTATNEPMVAEVEKLDLEDKTFESDYIDLNANGKNNFQGKHNFEDKQSGMRHHYKRAIPGGNIVELLVCPDESVYQHFLRKTGSDGAAIAAMRQFYALMVNEMDLHYLSVQRVDRSLSIRIYLADIVIARRRIDVPWSSGYDNTIGSVTYLNVPPALAAFRNWRLRNVQRLVKHDFAMGFSRKNLVNLRQGLRTRGIAGIAYLSVVCTINSVGLVEDVGNRVSLVAAHELGHGLGSSHDGDSGISASCNRNDHNIMTPNFLRTVSNTRHAVNQWTFSRCSVQAFKSFITRLGSNNCMRQRNFNSAQYDALRRQSLPGQYYSLTQQCQFIFGPSARACTTRATAKDCYDGIQCRPTSAMGCRSSVYLFAGTPCHDASYNAWCYNGECWYKSSKPYPNPRLTPPRPPPRPTPPRPTPRPNPRPTPRPTPRPPPRPTPRPPSGPNWCYRRCCVRFRYRWRWYRHCCWGRRCCNHWRVRNTICCRGCRYG